jgi:hypothetical protein
MSAEIEASPAESVAVTKSQNERDPLLPFAKAYNQYFRSVYDISYASHRKVCDEYPAYAKAIRAATDTQDLQAFHEANEKFRAVINDAADPSHVAAGVRAAFDTYVRVLVAAFASDDASSLDVAQLGLVAWSMAQVATNRLAYHCM